MITEEMAIEILEEMQNNVLTKEDDFCDVETDKYMALGYAIHTIKKQQEARQHKKLASKKYSSYSSKEKPMIVTDFDVCPNCNKVFGGADDKIQERCDKCGQILDWKELVK